VFQLTGCEVQYPLTRRTVQITAQLQLSQAARQELDGEIAALKLGASTFNDR